METDAEPLSALLGRAELSAARVGGGASFAPRDDDKGPGAPESEFSNRVGGLTRGPPPSWE